MTRKDIDDLRALINALVGTFEIWCQAVLPTLPPEGPEAAAVLADASAPVKAQTIAPQDPLLDDGNPWIRKDPAAWRGESCVGMRAGECPIDYLEVYLAALVDFSAKAATKAKEKGDKKAQEASDRAATEARMIDTIIQQKRASSAGQKRRA